MTGPRIVLAVTGVLLVIGGAILGVIGVGTLVAHQTDLRRDGFSITPATRVATPTRALVAEGVELNLDPTSFWDEGSDLTDVKLTARAAAGKRIFVGIGPAERVAEYLDGVSYDVLGDGLRPSGGARRAAAPASRRFWAASAEGADQEILNWRVRDGDWTVVVMNADASPGVRADVTVGERWSDIVFGGVENTIYGVGGVIGGIALLVANLRRRRPGGATLTPPPADTPPEPDPEPEPEPGPEPPPGSWPPEPSGVRGRGTPEPTPGPAIVSVAAGVLGLTMVPLVPSVAAVILGRHARRTIDASEAPIAGRGIATVGMWLGWAGIAVCPALIALLVLVVGPGG